MDLREVVNQYALNSARDYANEDGRGLLNYVFVPEEYRNLWFRLVYEISRAIGEFDAQNNRLLSPSQKRLLAEVNQAHEVFSIDGAEEGRHGTERINDGPVTRHMRVENGTALQWMLSEEQHGLPKNKRIILLIQDFDLIPTGGQRAYAHLVDGEQRPYHLFGGSIVLAGIQNEEDAGLVTYRGNLDQGVLNRGAGSPLFVNKDGTLRE